MGIVYEALKKVPGMTDNEAHEVASRLSRSAELATKGDVAELKGEIEAIKGEIRAIKWMVSLLVIMNIGLYLKLFF